MINKFLFALLLLSLAGGYSLFRPKTSELQNVLDCLSVEEISTLEIFFRTLLSKSQGGYVLYGNKPLCIEAFAYREKGSIFLDKSVHLFSTELKKGSLLWKDLGLEKYCKNYRLHISEVPTNEWQDILLINQKELLSTIENNLILFQYALGPNASAHYLLNQLLDPYKSFSSVIHHDRALTGILLGYGTQNSLFCSRAENIDEKIVKEPSCGFTSLQEENAWLQSKFSLSTEYSKEKLPLLPWFGCYDSKESQCLINSYKNVQKKIVKVLNSKVFLEEVLSKLFEEKVLLNRLNRLSKPSLPSHQELTRAVAEGIWMCVTDMESEYAASFIRGVKASEENAVPLSEEEFCELRNRFSMATVKEDSAYKAIRDEMAYYAGVRVWNYFKLGNDLYKFQDVIELLEEWQATGCTGQLSELKDRLLTDLCWIIYHRNS